MTKTMCLKPQLMVPPTLAVLSLLVAPFVLGDCKCGRPDKKETTHWGGNQVIVKKEEQSYRILQGTVEIGGQPLDQALVEVFDHPDYLLDQSSFFKRDHPEQRRRAACHTSADGKFCFRNLPSGKYELRSSLNSGVNVTQIYVIVDKKAGQKKSLKVLMEVGT